MAAFDSKSKVFSRDYLSAIHSSLQATVRHKNKDRTWYRNYAQLVINEIPYHLPGNLVNSSISNVVLYQKDIMFGYYAAFMNPSIDDGILASTNFDLPELCDVIHLDYTDILDKENKKQSVVLFYRRNKYVEPKFEMAAQKEVDISVDEKVHTLYIYQYGNPGPNNYMYHMFDAKIATEYIEDEAYSSSQPISLREKLNSTVHTPGYKGLLGETWAPRSPTGKVQRQYIARPLSQMWATLIDRRLMVYGPYAAVNSNIGVGIEYGIKLTENGFSDGNAKFYLHQVLKYNFILPPDHLLQPEGSRIKLTEEEQNMVDIIRTQDVKLVLLYSSYGPQSRMEDLLERLWKFARRQFDSDLELDRNIKDYGIDQLNQIGQLWGSGPSTKRAI